MEEHLNDSGFSNHTFDESFGYAQVEWSNWGFWVKFLSTPALLILGLVGNTLTLVVMKTKALRRKSYSHLLSALAVFDTLNLVIRQLEIVDEYFVDHLSSPGVFQDFNTATCRLYNFVSRVTCLMSAWLVTLIAVERYMAIRFPFKKMKLRQQSGSVAAIVALLVCACLSQLFRVTMIEHVPTYPGSLLRVCSAGNEYAEIYSTLDVYFYQILLTLVIPFVIVSVCNILVILTMRKSRSNFSDNFASAHCQKRTSHRTTIMLLTVSFTYLGSLLPLFSISLAIDISVKIMKPMSAWRAYCLLRPYMELGVAISLINYCSNFFIYVISGATFRRQLKSLIFVQSTKGQRKTSTPSMMGLYGHSSVTSNCLTNLGYTRRISQLKYVDVV